MRSTQGTTTNTAGPAGQALGHYGTGPAVGRMMLGARLRELRESEYISRREVAEALRTTHDHISHLELGRTGCGPRDIADLLTIYSVTDSSERSTLRALAEQANSRGWWDTYRDVVPDWLETYLSLEQAAAVIRTYEAQFVPGLLQTPEYARALIGLGHPGDSPARLRRRVELRTRRQEILRGSRSPHVWAVIDEAALRRPVGGETVMSDQIRYLIQLCDLSHVTLQVLPFHTAAQVPCGGPASLVRLPGRGLPDVVYLEQLTSAHYPEEAEDIEFYRHLIDRLVTMAEPPSATPAVLEYLLHQRHHEVPYG